MEIPVPGLIINGPLGEKTLLLQERLGAGSFGVVFKTYEEKSGNIYAVKFPQVSDFKNRDELLAFENEVKASQEIQHPNVVRIHYVETNAGNLPPYLVMEFISGGTLKSILDRRKQSKEMLDIHQIKHLTNGLLDGIETINQKMLHRDLKPDNILMYGDIPKIGDFGLSKVIGAVTRSRTFKGGQHIYYMAPEGWKYEKNEIQLDMYSMGIILYEIIALDYPYELPKDKDNLMFYMDMHLFQKPKELSDYRPDLPTALFQVVYRLLEKNPSNRFLSWSEVKDYVLKAWEAGEYSRTSPHSGIVNSLLQEATKSYESQTKERLEAERMKTETQVRTGLDEYQANVLAQGIAEIIAEYNKQSSLGKISITTSGTQYRYNVGNDGSVVLTFFWVEPQLRLRRGSIRFAASITNSYGPRCNYLLVRSDEEDLYGTWVGITAKNTTIIRLDKRLDRPEPFGFNKGEMKEIEMADGALHVFTVHYTNDITGIFFNAVKEEIRKTNK